MNDITPIIFLGAPRNGTTWLGNILNEVFGIPTAVHPLHYGLHESKTCKHYKKWGKFLDTDTYIEFLEAYGSCDYFQLAKGDKLYFYENPQQDFLDFYFELMDQFAKKLDSTIWCTKLDPDYYIHPKELSIFLEKINERYRAVKFVGIKRKYNAYFQSYLKMNGRSFKQRQKLPFLGYWLAAARYETYYLAIDKILANQNGLHLTFENLNENYELTIEQIKLFLGTKRLKLKTTAPANTSFHKQNRRKGISRLPKIIHKLVASFPFTAILILQVYEKLKPTRLNIYRRLLKAKYFRAEFINELKQSNDLILIDYLNKQDKDF